MRRIKSILARPALVIGLSLALVGGSAITFAAAASTGVIYACVNNSSGTIHLVGSADTCSTNEVALAWNQQGPKGDTGPQGPTGPAGMGGAAFYREQRVPMSIPNSYAEMHRIDLPEGKYLVTSTVLVNNLQPSGRIPVICTLYGGNGSSVIAAAQVEANGESGASATTLTNEYTTQWASPFSVQLLCASNNGPGGPQAMAEQMQITAIAVASITTEP